MEGQTQPGNQEIQKQNLCNVTGSYRATTNIKVLSLLFSIKRRKFIKPISRQGDRVSGEYVYTLLPGKYIIIECKYWTKAEPPYLIHAELITIGDDCRVTCGKSVEIMFEHGDWLMSQPIPGMLKDIYAWLPSYHTLPHPNFEKIYDETEIKQLLKMIEDGMKIIEGAEYE